MKYIYLDNNATTKVAPEVVAAMSPYFSELYANPSSVHQFGCAVANDLLKARKILADKINCSPDEIIFTASGSEADNLCIKGYCEANKNRGRHIITSVIEHPAILNSCKHLEESGYKITYVGVDQDGFINPDDIEKNITDDTVLVSIMHSNNEIGSIQPVEEISRICNKHKIAFHTDAVQSFLKVPLDVKALGITMASFSGHKIHAPKGIGFSYVKKGVEIIRQIDGGAQERKLRAGTENAPYIIGLAKAVEISSSEDIIKMRKIQEYLFAKLRTIDGIRINGPHDLQKRNCNNINIASKAITGEILLSKLSSVGICVSTGSACSSKSTRVSPVLQAINCPAEFIHGNIRISTSRYTTFEEADIFISELKNILVQKPLFVLNEL